MRLKFRFFLQRLSILSRAYYWTHHVGRIVIFDLKQSEIKKMDIAGFPNGGPGFLSEEPCFLIGGPGFLNEGPGFLK